MLKLSIAICLFLSAILGVVYFVNYGTNTDYNTKTKEAGPYALEVYEEVFTDGTHNSNDYVTIYKSRVEDYTDKKGSVLESMKFFAIVLLLGLFILFYRPEKFKVPFLDLEVPLNLLYVFVILSFIYLWGQFWLTFNAAIEGRIVLEHVADKIEESTDVTYHYSRARTLMDNGFIDTWCTYYHNIFKGGQKSETHGPVSGVYLFGSYALLWGFLFAMCFASASALHRNKKSILSKAMFIAVVWIMCYSSMLFILWVPHGLLFIAWVWLVTCIALALWLLFGANVADRIEQLKSHGN